jgi:LysR family glycine cleavage system transcriptional activator
MSRQLPGTRGLRTLEAAGRHLNFTRAADELGLTPAAVSHQIKEIEDQLGMTLFTRTSRSIRLTAAGELLIEASGDALDLLRRAISRAQKTTRKTVQLKVTTCAVLASKWLVPRLERFRSIRPDASIRIDVSMELRDFRRDDVDVAIRFGEGKYSGLRADRLFDNNIFPVCSPQLLKSGRPLKAPRDLLRHTLAHDEWSGMGWPDWRMWMTAAGVEDFDNDTGVHFSDSSQAIQAAIDGDVVALGDFAMVANDLSTGRLVRPFDLGIKLPSEFGYFLVYPPETASDPLIEAFNDWLLEEAGRTRSETSGS